ncbi:FecR family protein [Flavobacterium sp. UMI-01]|uniref:FecR family protein n=1 Tax=Flavobacterium sp. UMI-01 TaxID=1441053 RepID=UPI001C7DBB0D|nr:FecR family protein [Flavobacterium sp. UMI-01]GIZ09536.1 iron dicitrate transporter FecR [Flavobacterium sp. UMI-01]
MEIIDVIIKKLHHQNLSPEETRFFDTWLQESEKNLDFFTKLEQLKNKKEVIAEIASVNPELAWQKVIRKYEKETRRNQLQLFSKRFLRYAAVFVGVLVLGYVVDTFVLTKQSVILPSNEITLQSENGDVQVLSSNMIYGIKDANGKTLGAKSETKLDFRGIKYVDKLIYNTLTIPYGKKFEITLSDGTIVHLNSGSVFRFPIKFINGYKRKVNLIGEGYFEVSKDKKHPFIVETAQMNVTVLGTKFNVSAYPEDPSITTVLVEGSVSLSSSLDNSKEVARLSPGDWANWWIKTAGIKRKQVDTDIYTSWIDGRIVFKNQKFGNIIKKLERHYDVKIKNNYQELNQELFTASFDVETIEEALNSFAENKYFKFEIKDKLITINQP